MRHHATWFNLLAIAAFLGPVVWASEDPFAGLNLETHGYVSFGWLKSWENNWHGETLDGTSEFYEAAANVIARPFDRVRLGAQLFVRDLGVYGNGAVELDWAYADWRATDALGIQVGRVKFPYGLFNETLDVDAARSSVFLPRSLYPTRAREILLATDGAKAYGSLDSLDWAVYAGQRQLQEDGDFASYFAYVFRLQAISDIGSDLLLGGMVHWNTPVSGLATRLSLVWLSGFHLSGTSAVAPVTLDLEIPDWYGLVASLLYERGDTTVAMEYIRYYADRYVTTTPIGGGPTTRVTDRFRDDGLYLSATWHALPWLDLYGALEGQWNEPTDRWGDQYVQSAVMALALMPTRHWTLKAEFRLSHGTADVDTRLNPDGIADDWQVLALKTTVDF
jgi:hypothetical protein